MEDYGMLMDFSNHLYRIYFPLKDDKVIHELSKLLKVPNLTKNASGLKWKLLKAKLERKKSEQGSIIKRDKLITLGIFGLVLFPSLTGIISLEVVDVFVEYEDTYTNLVASILVETILTLNHFRRTGKGTMGCCTQLLYL